MKTILLTLALALGMSSCRTNDEVGASVKNNEGEPALAELGRSTQNAGHGMVVFGNNTIYMYHLPMWMGVHAWQIILEVSLDDEGLKAYKADRSAGSKLNTFDPDAFALASLAPGFSFSGTLFHGHFEQGGTALGQPNVSVHATVKRIVMVTPLTGPLKVLPIPTYRLFGDGSEWYLAHVVSRHPDFDQILSLEPVSGLVTNAQLNAGSKVEIAGKFDFVKTRLGSKAQVTGLLNGITKFQVSTSNETYFSTSDLGGI